MTMMIQILVRQTSFAQVVVLERVMEDHPMAHSQTVTHRAIFWSFKIPEKIQDLPMTVHLVVASSLSLSIQLILKMLDFFMEKHLLLLRYVPVNCMCLFVPIAVKCSLNFIMNIAFLLSTAYK